MKRSTQIGLAAVGVVLVAAIWSSGDDAPKEDLIYNSIDECKRDGQLGSQQCETLFADAAAKRLSEAPKFRSQSECEAQYGSAGCSAATIGGAQYFLPALAGFMLARSLSGGTPQATPLLPPTQQACPPGSAAPECQQARSSSSGSGGGYGGRGSSSYSRSYSTTSGSALVARSGSSSSSSASSSSASSSSVSSRGGFGSTSHSYHSSSSS